MNSSVIILGNGPSLNGQVHLMDEVKRFDTFACNRFVLWEHAFTPTYYVCNAQTVREDISPSNPPFKRAKFMLHVTDDGYEFAPGWIHVTKKPKGTMRRYSSVRSGATVTGCMVQLAAKWGYTDIYLIGVDHSGDEHAYVPANIPPQYDYFTPNTAWETWREIKEFYGERGVSIADCTPNGQLNDILGYKPLEEVLGSVNI